MHLYKMMQGIDAYPFSGEREITPTAVQVRDSSIPDSVFGPSCMIGKDRAHYHKLLKELGLTPEKTYTAFKVEGYGDVFDVFIRANDEGKEISCMENLFEEPTIIAKGTGLIIKHARKGTFYGRAYEDFDPAKVEWYPVVVNQLEDVQGSVSEWENGEKIPCRASLCTIEREVF